MIRVRGSVEGFKALLRGEDAPRKEDPEAPAERRGLPATGPVPAGEGRHAG